MTATAPTVSSATSFTSDSKAMATPSPACRSRGVTWRAPKSSANSVTSAQNMSAMPLGGEACASTLNPAVTAWICSAR